MRDEDQNIKQACVANYSPLENKKASSFAHFLTCFHQPGEIKPLSLSMCQSLKTCRMETINSKALAPSTLKENT